MPAIISANGTSASPPLTWCRPLAAFSSSLGYLNGAEDHWTQRRPACKDPTVVDLYATDRPAFGRNGTYGAQIYHDEALSIIGRHDPATPLFLYFAFQINHAPLQVPDKYKAVYPCADKNCTKRQNYQAMTAMADEVIGNVTDALRAKGMWPRLLVLMSSDNGGPSGTDADSANNFPLRGGKYSDFEGGVRVAAFVSGGFVPVARRGAAADGYIHLCDWYATLSRLAGVDPTDDATDSLGHPLPPIDSLDVWPYLAGDTNASPRTEIPLTVGPHQPACGGGLIVGRHKVLFGQQSPAFWNGPEYPNGTKPAPISVSCEARGCLFDILADPTEHDDLAVSHQGEAETEEILANLTRHFSDLVATAYQTPWAATPMDCNETRVQKMVASGFWAPWTDEHAPDKPPGERQALTCPGGPSALSS